MAVQGSPLVILGGAAGIIAAGVAGFLVFGDPDPLPLNDVPQVKATDDTTDVTVAVEAETAATVDAETAIPQSAVPEPAGDDAADTPAQAESAAVAPEDSPEPPSFDVVRVEPDGEALIAGNAMALSVVSILVDGVKIAEVEADRSGKFVSFLSIEPGTRPRVVSLMMAPADGGQTVSSVQTVILAPATVLAEAENATGTDGTESADVDTTPSDEAIIAGGGDAVPASVADAKTADTDAAASASETTEDTAVSTDDTPQMAEGETPAASAMAEAETAEVAMAEDETLAENGQSIDEDMVETAEATFDEDAVAPSQATVDAAAESTAETTEMTVKTGEVAEASDAKVAEAGAEAADVTDATRVAAVEPASSGNQTPDDDAPKADTAALEAETPADPADAQSPAVLLADDQGVRVLQSQGADAAAPEVMANVALDSITYTARGEVLLTGRGVGQGFVRIYLDNKPITTSRIRADGTWSVELPQVDTGIYTLRVDQVDEAGEVTSRIESPFKREAAEVVAAVQAEEAVRASAQGGNLVSLRTVQPGATLWAIARESYGEGVLYVKVFEANKDRIRDPDLIYPGQVFVVPN